MRTLTLQSPAKINLMLAITGRRADGFHDLVSVVAPLAWGDTLVVEEVAAANHERSAFTLTCDDPGVPIDQANLILKAAEAFRAATGWLGGARFALTKRIPVGAGLGGGSSNAATALRALNTLAATPLDAVELARLAASVGSDCALFLHDGPVVMRGRGDRVEPLPERAAARLRGRGLLVFKPAFAISTAWAYGRLVAAAPGGYATATAAEERLARWMDVAGDRSRDPIAELVFNNMESAAFAKFPALPLMLERLLREFGLATGMSGSGSACFAFLPDDAPVAEICAAVRRAWGESAFVIQTHLQ
ncbi:4-(cytidine 5'-diphospho)-2-C-methyl-D-erythritol kinase [Opitutus terrae]|uniref:4-diphosphocytidyl-2-C-methyl-D-erythritol kinase n=1 Tax=Opitutus terrae (strain DSM 11246 / JCM 15787 / PB90-1) TaxID=452637 RepID=B1ZSC5_OPITP|nr:4-(cytidine 5'-diphospho)-2-C-methyl-D-erythritol kinase [Opitutus terrae]ACB75724.1 4-diphosphocytidyl-2C-methyl-D-erythritol kinase [Opitutus terrae PB90-1]